MQLRINLRRKGTIRAGKPRYYALPARERPLGQWLLAMLGIPIGYAVFLLLLARVARLPEDRVLWTGIGAGLGLTTLLRPWWFWEHHRVLELRGRFGNTAVQVLYVAFALLFLYIGLATKTPVR